MNPSTCCFLCGYEEKNTLEVDQWYDKLGQRTDDYPDELKGIIIN